MTEGPASGFARRLGLALLVLASFLPYHGCIAHPHEFEPKATWSSAYSRDYDALVPAARVEYECRTRVLGQSTDGMRDRLLFGTLGDSNDYGFVIFFGFPLWLLLLGFARRKWGRDRRAVGRILWILSAAMPLLVGWALVDGDASGPTLHPGIGWLLAALAALFLAWRPPGRRRPEDIEATLSTHSLIAIGVVLCRPAIDLAQWTFRDGYSLFSIALAMPHNYRPGFYVTMAALCLLAAPLYYSEETFRGLYDRCRPWRPRSSTPTPTSTSTGSTPTASPSSTAPAPPGSSPS